MDTGKWLAARVSTELAQRLEDYRYKKSRAMGARLSTKKIVVQAIEEYLKRAEK